MALNFLLKRSGTGSKRPTAASMALGELDLNYDASTGGLFYKDSAGSVVKVGPAEVGSTAPNATPAGSSGNSTGEFWYDTGNSVLKVYNGTSWVATVSTASFLPLAGGTMTGAITFAAGQTFPVEGIQDGTTSQKGVVQLSDSTSSTSTTLAATANAVKAAYDAGVQGQTDAATALAAANASGSDVGTLSSLTTTDKSSAVAAINEVNAAAGLAQSDATQALSDAAAAQSDATQALSDAAAAQTTANNAQSDATQALSDAAAAQSDATQALSAAAAAQATAAAAVPDASYTALGDILGGTGSGTYSALSVGSDGQVLTACSACASGLTWAAGGGGASQATPTTLGTVYGCICVADGNVGLGYNTMCGGTVVYNTALGDCTLQNSSFGSYNTAIGHSALKCNPGSSNTAIGSGSLSNPSSSGGNNVAIGFNAGALSTTGEYNVLIGSYVDTSAPTASCELAIGYTLNQCWLTGTPSLAIKPGAGIIDCAGSCGTAGQVLQSNGSNAIQWATPSSGFSGYNGYTATTSGTKFNVTGYPGEMGINYAGQLNIFTIYNSGPADGRPPYTPGSNALIFLNGFNGVGTTTVQAMNTSTGTFAVESVLYPAYTDITVTFTPTVTTDRMNFYMKFADGTGNGGPYNGSIFTQYLTIF